MSSWFVQTRVETDRDGEARVGALEREVGGETVVVVYALHSANASSLAARKVFLDLLDELPAFPESPDEWEGALRMADRRLARDTNVGRLSAVAITLTAEGAVGASVGECRCWLLGDASWETTRLQHARPLLGTTEAQPIGFGPVGIDVAMLLGTPSLFEQVAPERAVQLVEDGATAAPEALVSACRSAELGRLAADVGLAVVRRKH
jgi:hypothetical protein